MTLRYSFALAIAGSLAFAHARLPHVPTKLPLASDSSIFAPLTNPPAPSKTRSANGAPGPKYWQNSADYDLHATLDTTSGTLQGTMTLRYTNHSPNTLTVLSFQTEQNAFRTVPATRSTDAPFGDIITQCTEMVDGQPAVVSLEEHETETQATLPRAIRPGATAIIHMMWHFVVPRMGSGPGRMGRQGSLYQIAQWYPRVNVYDDVKGWNIEPYLGDAEFFLEYGTYTLSVTLPTNYIVGATGTLDNPRDVLTPTEIARLAHAAKTDSVIPIVTAAELTDGTAHLKHDGMVTWTFHADNVRDAVFAASPDYQWDATSWKGIIAQAYYRPSAASVWHEVADMGHMSIQEFSTRWFMYPYPQVSVAEGPIGGGMEYPMMSFDGVFPTTGQYTVVTHEIGHEWFPMVVGSNERVHPWMDEGLNSFIDTFSEALRYPQNGDQTARGDRQRAGVQARLQRHKDFVMDVPGDSTPAGQYTAYNKPVGVLQMLRRDVIGPELFDKALRTYIQRWAYKHPTPQDFFRTMEDVAGQHLDWFWREWFYETPSFDQAIDSVAQTTSGGATQVTVVYGNHARGVLPLLVHFVFADSTTQEVTYPADVWRANATRYTRSYTFPKPVIQIVVDAGHHLVDVDRGNNVWPAQRP